jgi:hypothetical protein
MPTVIERQLDPVVRVDRTILPRVPEIVKSFDYPELQNTGHTEYDLYQIQLWPKVKELRLPRGSKYLTVPINRHTTCDVLYKYLLEVKSIERCLNLQDGEMIIRKHRRVYAEAFSQKGVFLFKSLFRHKNGNICVPYVCKCSGDLVIRNFLITDKCIPEIYIGVFEDSN